MIISAEKLRQQMTRNNYSAKELARAAHLSLSAVQKLLRGDVTTPRPTTLGRLVLALKCSACDIGENF